jgi:signal transduction histidine kinase
MHVSSDDLRILAASDPKAARQLVESLLDGDVQILDQLLASLVAPDEGRLRQLVANTVRQRPDREKVVPHLLRWLPREHDEFARRSIQAALDGIDLRQRQADGADEPPDLIQTYRYVAGRLCHRVRNAMPASMTHIRQIEDLCRQTSGTIGVELLSQVEQLRTDLRDISRLVEFETDDEYFAWRDIAFADWLKIARNKYNGQNKPLTQVEILEESYCGGASIRANEYLLETIFWNLWRNSQEAVNENCRVAVTIKSDSGRITLLITDNGPGLPQSLVTLAFDDRISTRGSGRGRGLLEVADAVQRLSGDVSVVYLEDDGYRIQLSFPAGAR